jgi:branched-chain amino acid transport system ATP-binding protein
MRPSSQNPETDLVMQDFAVYRGSVRILSDINLCLTVGTLVAVVGANGSGKSALVQALAGLLRHTGEVRLGGMPLDLRDPAGAVQSGVVLCPSDRGVFHRLTVEENLLVGGYTLPKESCRVRAEELLARFPDIARRRDLRAGLLSGGERQQLAIARSLMVSPKVLLLDEPSRGLSPAALASLLEVLRSEARHRTIVTVVDQALDWLFGHTDRLLIMAEGRITADVDPCVRSSRNIVSAYFDLG